MLGCRFCGRPLVALRCTVCGAGLCGERHFRLSCAVLHPEARAEPLVGAS